MLKTINVVWVSLKMALEELRVNKLRTFLSLFGVTIGIFCIIGVLATVKSLQKSVEDGLKDLGTNTIYIEKWPWGGGEDYPWWKYLKRPNPKYEELKLIKERSRYTEAAAFILFTSSPIEYGENTLQNVNWYGATEDFNRIQEIKIGEGRYISSSEFNYGSNAVVMGFANAEKLFGNAQRAVGKQVKIAGRTATIIGVMKKNGSSLIGGWDFDNIIIVPFNFCRQMVNERNASRLLMVKGKEGVTIRNIKDELKGVMRSIRKLQPTQDDDFALNDVTASSKQLETFFGNVNMAGFIIGGFSLVVGLFGIANIMFVTVKERTSQIGLKKAIGAKQSYILTEFLLESSFLCILGGLTGLLLVFLLTKAISASKLLPFPVSLAPDTILLGLVISVAVGLLAGFIPAWNAAKMDPVAAIRSK